MKTVLRWAVALCTFLVSTMTSGATLPKSFTLGYNEAWIGNNYGNWLASNPLFGESSAFSSSLVSALLSGMAQGNAEIVRIFLFPAVQGISINSASTPETQGLTSEFLSNLGTVFQIARSYKLKLYITALNANDMSVVTPINNPTLHTYYQNLISNGAETSAYETLVLAPILELMSANRDVIYAFDLIDEIEAAINAGYFSNSWTGARAWIQNITTFVKSSTRLPTFPRAPATTSWLPVTSTAGLGYAVQEITLGLFSGLGLDFYDLHFYADSGQYSGQSALCDKVSADKVSIVLGEYGQQSQTYSDSIQLGATTNFLEGARTSCFSAALAWKYEDPNQTWFTYLKPDGTFRPAYYFIQSYGPFAQPFSAPRGAQPLASGPSMN